MSKKKQNRSKRSKAYRKSKEKFSIRKWFIDRCKGVVNSTAEDVIRGIILWALYNLFQLL